MKKTLVVLVLLSLAISGFALDFSAGLGANLNFESPDLKYTMLGTAYDSKSSVMPINIKAFFDATYLQGSVGYEFISGYSNTVTPGSTTNYNETLTYMNFALYGKYPFALGQAITVFPLLGAEYRLNLTWTSSSGADLKSAQSSQYQSDMNELWLEAGAGADFAFGRFYIRPEVLLGYKPLSTTDNNSITALQGLGATSVSMSYFAIKADVLLGYRF
ncbi:MAG: hypothetical protein ABSG17_12320 [Spirochaetia bacterium]|jgi:hypothetical protein